MQLIIPMSGVGRRFLKEGYRTPKPLLHIEGKPMIQHVVERFDNPENILFICNMDHLKKTPMLDVLTKIAPQAKIVGIDAHKLGPVHALNKVKNFITNDDEVVVNYCDFNWGWDYQKFKQMLNESNCQGAIPGYTGFHPHLVHNPYYAGCDHDEDHNLVDIKEKHRYTIDPKETFHSSGTYYFRSGELLKKYSQMLVDKNMSLKGEFYVSMIYQLMLEDGLPIKVFPIEHMCQWGTPQDFQEYVEWSDAFANGTAQNLVTNDPNSMKTFEYWQSFFNK